jgi:hypothetical protein
MRWPRRDGTIGVIDKGVVTGSITADDIVRGLDPASALSAKDKLATDKATRIQHIASRGDEVWK